MAHVKALNKAKNKSLDEGPESPHHTPITGRGRNGDSDDDEPVSCLFPSETLRRKAFRRACSIWFGYFKGEFVNFGQNQYVTVEKNQGIEKLNF